MVPPQQMRLENLWICLVAGVVAAGTAKAIPPATQSAGPSSAISRGVLESPVDLPLEFQGGWPVVRVRINDQGPFRLVLDTGANWTLLSKSLARRLRLPAAKKTMPFGSRKTTIVTVRTIELGPLKFQGEIRTLADDIPFFDPSQMPGDSRPVDGLLGFNLFQDIPLTVDYPHRRLILESRHLPKPDGRDVLPMSLVDNVPCCTIRMAQKEITVAIDTGNTWWLTLPEKTVRQLALHKGETRCSFRGFSGQQTCSTARFAGTVHIGRHVLTEPFVTHLVGVPGRSLLGYHILRHFAVTLDVRQRAVRFYRPSNTPIRCPESCRPEPAVRP